ncbi:MAG: hypothetical protein JXR64_09015 [Spirochaetales bacterium]|nr:hypothetical protein [Spirochaetales bacterium]
MLNYLEPKISKIAIFIMRSVGPLYVKFIEKVSEIDLTKSETLKKSLNDFKEGKIRLIVAFRHPTQHDPAVLMHVINNCISKRNKHHAQFVYGSWVLTWATPIVKWLFPRIGAIPVSSRGSDFRGIKEIRKSMLNSNFPIAIAPEAQVNYHNNRVGELEDGIINIASWCKDDLIKNNRTEDVVILPVTTHYIYGNNQKKELDKLFRILSRRLSFYPTETDVNKKLFIYTQKIMELVKNQYGIHNEDIIETVLKKAELPLRISSSGSILNRVLTIRAKAEENNSSDLLEILKDMEVADILEYIDYTYLEDNNINRQIEYLLNLYDLHNRLINGGTIANRYNKTFKKVLIISDEPIIYKAIGTREEKRMQNIDLKNELHNRFNKISNYY